jgi:hypothetical protein
MTQTRVAGAVDGEAEHPQRLGHNQGPPLVDPPPTTSEGAHMSAQTIFRVVNPNKSYTKLSNTLLGDRKLRFETKGFLVSILMLPADWAFHVTWLCNEYGTGKDKAYALVKEAIKRGYCRRVYVRTDGGTVSRVEYHFSDDPADFVKANAPLPDKPEVGKPLPALPDLAVATSGKAGHIQRKDTDKGLTVTKLPPTPRKRRGAREAALETLIEDVRSNPERERVVDHLIAPAIRLRTFSAPDKGFALGQIADSAKGLSDEELAETLRRLTETRRQSVKQVHFEDAIKATKEAALALSKKRHAAQRRNRDPAMAARTDALHERLRNRLGREIFESWFTGLECEGLDGAVLTVSVEIPFKKNWIGSHYRDDLEEQAREEFGSGVGRVDVIVREAGRVAA